MLVSDIPSFKTRLAQSPLVDDRLWARDLEQISDLEIQLFYARAHLRGLKKEAVEAIDQLQSDLILAAVDGDVPQAALRLITHEPPVDRFSVNEFLDKLVKVSTNRRMAILYALGMRQDPEKVAELSWQHASQLQQLPGLCSEILQVRSRVRHLKLGYVFWEWATPKIAAPLLNLRESAEDAFDMPWPSIQARWIDMLWINDSTEKRSFLGLVEEVCAGKL